MPKKDDQQQEVQEQPNEVFLKCLEEVVHKKVSSINPQIFRTNSITQKVPSAAYLNEKRSSVFQKVDLKGMDFNKIPNYPKPPEQLAEIVRLLKNSFLTKKLADEDV